ncbi:MAG: hypothetical protein RMJ97_03195 [Raineya sp.]|nr:hypothetical protein [Raineya sp.]MDW8295868.1 hypothetical protein [Raineya sp.]
MNKIYIQPVVEDVLQEKVLQKLFQHLRNDIELYPAIGKKGNSYILERLASFNEASIEECRYFVLLDMDKPYCIVDFLQERVNFTPKPYFSLRVCVLEVETWLLADRQNFAKFLGVTDTIIPVNVEEKISQPKEFVISLAQQSKKKEIKTIIPEGTAKQGKGYNIQMLSFVENLWDFQNASKNCKSLQKTIQKIKNF